MVRRKDMLGEDAQEKMVRRRIKVFKSVFGSEDGLSVLRYLCKYWHTFDAVRPPLDPYALAYKAGTDAVMEEIIKMLDLDPIDLARETNEGID